MKSVCVLLSTYNGEKYLRQQLDSVLNQKGIILNFLVRDDGSTDSTIDILKQYEKDGKIKLIVGKNIGYKKSFYELAKLAPLSDYYAFCDQDDVWDDDKLITAVNMLERENNSIPLLYFSALRVVNKNLKVKSVTHKKFIISEYPFEQALTLNPVYGCAAVFNNALREKFLEYQEFEHSHDNNLNVLASALGKVVFDKTPHFSYRQHGNNCFGYPSSLKSMIKNIKWYFKYEVHNIRLKEMTKIKEKFYTELSEHNKHFCDLVLNYRNSKQDKKALLNYKPYKTDSKLTNFYIRHLIKHEKL